MSQAGRERFERPAAGLRRHAEVHDTSPRLFFAVPLPEPARAAVAAMVQRVRAPAEGVRARWVRFESLHLTLQFLGPTPEDALPRLGVALAEIAARTQPFMIVLAGAGAFPGPARPRTLWIGLTAGSEQLANLAAALADDPRIAELLPARPGDPPGTTPKRFAAHLTIARTDGVRGAASVARALQAEAADLEVPFAADRVVLYRSHLGAGPARYEALTEARLGG